MKQLLSALALGFSLFTAASAHAGPQVKLKFDVQSTKMTGGKLDLLFVVDDSGSMQQFQNQLQTATQKFATAFNSLQSDVHAAVTTTSAEGKGAYCQPQSICDGKFKDGYISNRSVQKFSSELASRLVVGTNGAATEKVFEPILLALEAPLRNPENAGFLRDDAQLVIVFVTDAEDQSDLLATDFVTRVAALKGGDLNRVAFIGAFIPTGSKTSQSCTRDQGEPTRIEEALRSLRGTSIELCTATMGEEVARAVLAFDLPGTTPVPVEIRDFKLPVQPKLSTLKVTFGSESLTGGDVLGGWSYRSNTGNLLVGEKFDYKSQPEGTKLEIEFEAASWPTLKGK